MEPLVERVRPLVEEQVLPRYQALSHRDQRMLMLLAVFLAITLPLFGMILPLHDKLQATKQQVAGLKLQAADAEQLAMRLQQGVKAGAGGGSVMATVDRIARSSGVRQFMTRIRPQNAMGDGETLMVNMKDAPYKESISFLSSLAEAGLELTELKLQAAEAAGHIHFQAVISGG